MVEFLTTSGITYTLEKIIDESQRYIYLVSPYLKISERFKQELEDKDAFKLDIRIIYGKTDLKPSEIEWLEKRKSIKVCFCKNLHAKCYMNEDTALITSMNMYESSMINNEEMGIAVHRREDPELYDKILNQVMKLIRMSEDVQLSIKITEKKKPEETPIKRDEKPVEPEKPPLSSNGDVSTGFCIRCGDVVEIDREKPYCNKCFKSWNRWKNPDYIETDGYCHTCGEKHPSTMRYPFCESCKPGLMNTLKGLFKG